VGPPVTGFEARAVASGGQDGQLTNVEVVSSQVFSPFAMVWMVAFALMLLRQSRD